MRLVNASLFSYLYPKLVNMELVHTLLDIKDNTIKKLEDKVTKLEKENQELRAALAFEERNHRRYNKHQ